MLMALTGDEQWCKSCNGLMVPYCVNGCTGQPLPEEGTLAPARIREHRLLAGARVDAWVAVADAFGPGWTDAKHRVSRALSDLERRAFAAGRATEKWSAARRSTPSRLDGPGTEGR